MYLLLRKVGVSLPLSKLFKSNQSHLLLVEGLFSFLEIRTLTVLPVFKIAFR